MTRKAQHPIEPSFVARWSPRAMSGKSLERAEVLRLLEAARWAPSAGNRQPWRFVFAHRGTPAFDAMFDALNDGNKVWNVRAGALIAVLSRTLTDEGKPIGTHSFDAGAAWMALALQGSAMGLVVHGMGGLDKKKAHEAMALPEDVVIECFVAVGRPGAIADLPEHLHEREKPSDRLPIESLAFEGRWGGV